MIALKENLVDCHHTLKLKFWLRLMFFQIVQVKKKTAQEKLCVFIVFWFEDFVGACLSFDAALGRCPELDTDLDDL